MFQHVPISVSNGQSSCKKAPYRPRFAIACGQPKLISIPSAWSWARRAALTSVSASWPQNWITSGRSSGHDANASARYLNKQQKKYKTSRKKRLNLSTSNREQIPNYGTWECNTAEHHVFEIALSTLVQMRRPLGLPRAEVFSAFPTLPFHQPADNNGEIDG